MIGKRKKAEESARRLIEELDQTLRSTRYSPPERQEEARFQVIQSCQARIRQWRRENP
jgi:hypothetical protein